MSIRERKSLSFSSESADSFRSLEEEVSTWRYIQLLPGKGETRVVDDSCACYMHAHLAIRAAPTPFLSQDKLQINTNFQFQK